MAEHIILWISGYLTGLSCGILLSIIFCIYYYQSYLKNILQGNKSDKASDFIQNIVTVLPEIMKFSNTIPNPFEHPKK